IAELILRRLKRPALGLGRVLKALDRGLRAQPAAGGVVGQTEYNPVRGLPSALPATTWITKPIDRDFEDAP
ncbi:hypothetical protein, partial [Actinophytocola xanthii]